MKCVRLVLMIVVLAGVSRWCLADAAVWQKEVEGLLGRAWEELSEKLPKDREVTVAVIPFVDNYGGVRQLGILARGMLEGYVVAAKNARAVERTDLETLMREKDFQASDLVQGAGGSRQAHAVKVLSADYLALGKLTITPREVTFMLRLVDGSGEIISRAHAFSVRRDLVRDVLAYVQRPASPPPADMLLPPIELAFTVKAQRETGRNAVQESVLSDGGALASGDQFQITFRANSDCWVYLFLHNSSGECESLFPYPGIQLDHRCRGGVRYVLPDPEAMLGSRWYVLDDHAGTETLYIVAGYESVGDLDALLNEMQTQGGHLDAAAVRKGVDAARRRAADPPEALPGMIIDPAYRSAPADPQDVGEVLRGTFSVVREFRIEHR